MEGFGVAKKHSTSELGTKFEHIVVIHSRPESYL